MAVLYCTCFDCPTYISAFSVVFLSLLDSPPSSPAFPWAISKLSKKSYQKRNNEIDFIQLHSLV